MVPTLFKCGKLKRAWFARVGVRSRSREGAQWLIVLQREPDHVLVCLEVRLGRVFGKAVERLEVAISGSIASRANAARSYCDLGHRRKVLSRTCCHAKFERLQWAACCRRSRRFPVARGACTHVISASSCSANDHGIVRCAVGGRRPCHAMVSSLRAFRRAAAAR